MRVWVGLTDRDWFDFLAARAPPYSQLGPHAPENGLLLRSDLDTLFDQGYVSVAPDLRLPPATRRRDPVEDPVEGPATSRRLVGAAVESVDQELFQALQLGRCGVAI